MHDGYRDRGWTGRSREQPSSKPVVQRPAAQAHPPRHCRCTPRPSASPASSAPWSPISAALYTRTCGPPAHCPQYRLLRPHHPPCSHSQAHIPTATPALGSSVWSPGPWRSGLTLQPDQPATGQPALSPARLMAEVQYVPPNSGRKCLFLGWISPGMTQVALRT